MRGVPCGILRTSGFRMACVGAGLAALSAAVVFSVIYYETLVSMRVTLDGNIIGEMREVLVNGPKTPLEVAESEVRAALKEHSTRIFYLVTDNVGFPLVGDLNVPMPSLGWHDIEAGHSRVFAAGVTDLRVDVVALPDGARLLVGADSTILKHLDLLIRRSFAIGFGIMLVIGLAAGIGFGRRALARVETVSTTTREIMAGDFSRRIPPNGSHDEFDRLAHTVNAMLDRIEQLMENLHAVGSEIAHDLRSPLGRLRGVLELALRVEHVSELRALIAEAVEQTDSALSLCGAILRLSQVESGMRGEAFEPTDLTQLVRRLAETYEIVAEERGDHFQASIDEGLILAGDASLLNQLFANLIENAMKHASPHASVMLRVWRDRTAIVARIEDNGPGIPVERHADALRRFGRLDKARHTPGHGLGLPLAVAIAEMHKAKLSLADAKTEAARPGLAVTICFALPEFSA